MRASGKELDSDTLVSGKQRLNRKFILAAIVVSAVAIVALFAGSKLSTHNVELKAYFADAHGLKAGATVRVAGVDVGRVISVRARPGTSHEAAEVVMLITTPYELKVPADSTVSLRTAGILGETYPEIDVRDKSSSPAANGAVLKAVEVPMMSTQEMLDSLNHAIQQANSGAQNAKPIAPAEQPPRKH